MKGAVLERVDRHGDVAVAGDENDRERRAATVELLLKLESGDPGHAHVEDKARGVTGAVRRKESLGARERGNAVTRRFEEPAQRIAHRVVVVDDGDRARFGRGNHAYTDFREKWQVTPAGSFWLTHTCP